MCGSQYRFSPISLRSGRAGAFRTLSWPSLRRRPEALTATPAMASGQAEAAAPRVAELEEELRSLAEELSRCQVPESGGEGLPGAARLRCLPTGRLLPAARECRGFASLFRRSRRAGRGSGSRVPSPCRAGGPSGHRGGSPGGGFFSASTAAPRQGAAAPTCWAPGSGPPAAAVEAATRALGPCSSAGRAEPATGSYSGLKASTWPESVVFCFFFFFILHKKSPLICLMCNGKSAEVLLSAISAETSK